MENGGAVGGGVLLALAAGLWLVYLIPSWLRRREYLATERNAVRLQQTLRVLAETAEVPYQGCCRTTHSGARGRRAACNRGSGLGAATRRAQASPHSCSYLLAVARRA